MISPWLALGMFSIIDFSSFGVIYSAVGPTTIEFKFSSYPKSILNVFSLPSTVIVYFSSKSPDAKDRI